MSQAVVVGSLMDASGAAARKVARCWGKGVCRGCGLRVSVHGGGSVDWTKPLIAMANHQSHLDIPVLYASLPESFGMLAKEELFRVPVFGSAMRCMKCVPIDRGNRRQSFASLCEAARMVRGGSSIVVFPEGTRSPDGRIHELKKGPFYLADMAKVPIVPVGIRGTRQALAKGALIIRNAEVTVNIGEPIRMQGKGGSERDRLQQVVRQALVELSGLPAA